MADRKLAHWQIASLTIIILIIPLIIVFQLTKADIVIDVNSPIAIANSCLIKKDTKTCTYDEADKTQLITITESDATTLLANSWKVTGESVLCNEFITTADFGGEIRESTEIKCFDTVFFDKEIWDRQVSITNPDCVAEVKCPTEIILNIFTVKNNLTFEEALKEQGETLGKDKV